MDVVPTGIVGSVAGTPLSQSNAVENDKTARDAVGKSRDGQASLDAEKAAEIGQTQQDAGRNQACVTPSNSDPHADGEDQQSDEHPTKSKDAGGLTGNQLDVTG